MSKYIKLILITSLIVVIDQLTKAWVQQKIPLYGSIDVVQGFFSLTNIMNPGGAFGFLANQSPGIRHGVFIFVSFIAIALILYFYIKTPKEYSFLSFSFMLIFGGAIGNMIDRLRFGAVIDFLDVYVKNWHWPAFNAADSAISIGMTIIVFHLILNKLPE